MARGQSQPRCPAQLGPCRAGISICSAWIPPCSDPSLLTSSSPRFLIPLPSPADSLEAWIILDLSRAIHRSKQTVPQNEVFQPFLLPLYHQRAPCLRRVGQVLAHLHFHTGDTFRQCPTLLGLLVNLEIFTSQVPGVTFQQEKRCKNSDAWQPWALCQKSFSFTSPLLALWKRALKARYIIKV